MLRTLRVTIARIMGIPARLIVNSSHCISLTSGQRLTVKGDSTGSILRAATSCRGMMNGTTMNPKRPAQVRITPRLNSNSASSSGGIDTHKRNMICAFYVATTFDSTSSMFFRYMSPAILSASVTAIIGNTENTSSAGKMTTMYSTT